MVCVRCVECAVRDGAIATGWEGWGSEGAGGPAGGYEGAEEEDGWCFVTTQVPAGHTRMDGWVKLSSDAEGRKGRESPEPVRVRGGGGPLVVARRYVARFEHAHGPQWVPVATRPTAARVRGLGSLTKQYAICTYPTPQRSAHGHIAYNNTLCTYAPAF